MSVLVGALHRDGHGQGRRRLPRGARAAQGRARRMNARFDAVLAAAQERELDVLLVTNVVNVRWLTGFTGSNAAALVGANQRRFLTDFRYLTQAAEQLDELWEREISTDLLKRAVEGLPGDRPLRLGFDDAHLTVKQHAQLAELVPDGVELVAAGGVVERLRAVKDAAEIDAIRAAAQARRRRARGGARRRPRRAHASSRSRSTSRWRCAAAARRPSRSRRSSPPASTARCRTPSRATSRSPPDTLVVDRLGRAPRRLRLGLHAHVRDRRARPARPRRLRPRPARPGGGARRRAARPDRQGGRRRRARDHRAGRPRRALRPRPRPRRRARGPRGPAALQAGRGRARGRQRRHGRARASTCRARSACGSRTSSR